MSVSVRGLPDDFWETLQPPLGRRCSGDAFEIVRNRFIGALRPYGSVGPLEEFELSTQRHLDGAEEPDFYVLDDNLYGFPVVRLEGGEPSWCVGALEAVAEAAREVLGILEVALGDCGFLVTPGGVLLGGPRLQDCRLVEEMLAAILPVPEASVPTQRRIDP